MAIEALLPPREPEFVRKYQPPNALMVPIQNVEPDFTRTAGLECKASVEAVSKL